MTLRPPLPGHQLKIGVDGLQQPRHIVMGNGNTFRRAGGARRVDEVGDVVGVRHYRQGRTRLAIHRAAVDVHDSQPVPRQPVRQFRGGHHDHRPGITQHKPQPRIRHRRINRHIRRTRLQHPHDRHHSLNRPRQQQRHPLPRPHPMRNQQVRQPIRRLIQPPIRHRPPTTTDRNSPRITHHLLGKQLRNRQRRQRHQHHRHHIGRQPVRQRGPQFRGIGSSGEVTDQPLVTGPVLAGDHNSLPNTI
ncbi:Uncharacterised protein [Mycobacteroides abscessus]|nr:Uncharacterised protein [Mycobacteroides abscessus]